MRSRNNNLKKSLKDYAVPLIWLFLILILLYSVFAWWESESSASNDNIKYSNISDIKVNLSWENSKAYIVYESWKKVEIEDSISLWKSEKITVESWEVDIDFPFLAKMKLSRNTEFMYWEDWSFHLESANLWLEAVKDLDISMKYWNVSLKAWSVANLNQNEVESSIYSINNNIVVSNLAWLNVNLPKLSKIVISSKDSTQTDLDLDNFISPIDDYFKLSSWFKLNNWDIFLIDKDLTNSWSLNWSWTLVKQEISDLLTFDNIVDESYVNTNPIDLTWRYEALKIWKITIDWTEVSLNNELWTFSLKWFILKNKTNDLVIKVFDKNNNIIAKRILTLYSSSPKNTWSWNQTLNKNLESFAVKATDFLIYEPSTTWKFTTTSSQVTIRWKVSNKDVVSVLVNDYKLKSYNWSTWRYHAFVEQGTLKNGANNYEIEYLDKDWNLIYKEYYSIYKEVKKVSKVVENEKKIISSEAELN